jgi:hypothetical protein
LVIVRQTNVNGHTREDRLLVPGREPDPEVVVGTPGAPMTGLAPVPPPVIEPPPVVVPPPPPPPTTVTVSCTVQSVSNYADKDARLTVRCNTNGAVSVPKGTAFSLTVPR